MLVSRKNTIFLVAVQYLFLVILWGLEGGSRRSGEFVAVFAENVGVFLKNLGAFSKKLRDFGRDGCGGGVICGGGGFCGLGRF